tara:strand:+ start:203 stop:1039 length:837 start_codon:yes stop_codon:yes gene_type:complete
MKKVGIIGLGFVGGSINRFFKDKVDVFNFDINGDCNCLSLEEVIKKSEIIFICLPTPMMKNKDCDLTIIKTALKSVSKVNSQDKTIVLKSTIPPGTCEKISKEFKLPNLVFNPEFLTEANAYNDFVNQDRIILGGSEKHTSILKSYFQTFFPNSEIVETDYTTAELVKYVTNCFLAVKVSFANEIFDLTESLNINYQNLINIAMLDKRLGLSHWSVPGPDGKRGFGGSCFPKDMNALNQFYKNRGLKSFIIDSSVKRNEEKDRTEKDWKLLKGRAVSE